jgi:hypothetical protein
MVKAEKEFDYIKIKLEFYNGHTGDYQMDSLLGKFKNQKQ